MKGFQYITCPELRKGPLIKVQTGYMKICHIVSNKSLAVTTTENKSEVHILLINEDKVEIIERISLGHYNVSIAATPINFVVVDGSENKMVFYSTCGEELFQKYLPFYGNPHHIYSDNVYFYVLFKRHSIFRCYDIYGEIKWQWELPFPVHPDIAVFQGILYVPDTQLNRVLLYKYQDRSSGCCLPIKNPHIRNLNLRLKEKENDQKLLIGEICNLANGQLVVSDINHDCLLYISQEGDILSRFSLPSTATDICRWDSNRIGITLPLQKQLRVIGNLSKTVRSVSLRQPYVRVCKMGEGEIVCYCDKPSHLDILAINYYNQVELIKTINIPVFVKSLSIDKKIEKLLIVTRGKAFQFNTRIGGGGRGGRQMVPTVLMSQAKRPLNLQGGSIDHIGGDGDGGRRRGKSGEIISKGRLKVRCGNYIAEINNSGIDEISVRRLPYRTAMVPFSIPAFEEPVDYDLWDIRDLNSKLIKLDENVSVLIFRESVTLIRTTTTTTVDMLQHEQQQRPPLDICWWTEECFIVAFGREMRVFNRDLCRLRSITTEKYYNRLYKYNDVQLMCGGHYIRDITQEQRHKKYRRIRENNKVYYYCDDPNTFDSYYVDVDVVDIKDGKCKDEVCHGKMRRLGRFEGDSVVDDVGVTSFGDVFFLRGEMKEEFGSWAVLCIVEWFREKSLVRKMRIGGRGFYGLEYYIPRPRLTIIGECVYITDIENNIYEIPRHIEEETSEDNDILILKDNPKYLLPRGDDNEVFEVLGLDVSENSLMVFGIIPGRQPFAFFYFEK
ncbi:Hypothetical predicted protein [Octopus vulgaris]|uniref:Uncharacterized protein n=1 Tax=Octopus vulgaris TaxID=6645 RepID=A0AA36C0S4_OCTVU|nr:Hypothetical predicted protein [Octopus vulgaris]